MLKKLKEFSKLKSDWKNKWQTELVDIIIFGSYVRGKLEPNDIDVCLIFRNNIDVKIIKQIELVLGNKYHISSLTIDNFFTNPHSLSKTILLEGISVISGKKFADAFSLTPKALYNYDLSKEELNKKVKFVHLMHGRSSSAGIVKNLDGEFISNNSFIIPIEKDAEVQKIFDSWVIKYKRMKFMLME